MSDPNFDLRPAIMTNALKTVMMFIDRVGFPILAFLLMWYLNFQLTKTINELNNTLTQIKNIIFMTGGRSR